MRLEEMPTLEGEIERLKQQLAKCQAELDRELQRRFDGNREASKEYAEVSRELAECQAREKVLRDALEWVNSRFADVSTLVIVRKALALPSDSTALDTMLKQAKREALLDAAEQMESYCGPTVYYELHRMAKELEETK